MSDPITRDLLAALTAARTDTAHKIAAANQARIAANESLAARRDAYDRLRTHVAAHHGTTAVIDAQGRIHPATVADPAKGLHVDGHRIAEAWGGTTPEHREEVEEETTEADPLTARIRRGRCLQRYLRAHARLHRGK